MYCKFKFILLIVIILCISCKKTSNTTNPILKNNPTHTTPAFSIWVQAEWATTSMPTRNLSNINRWCKINGVIFYPSSLGIQPTIISNVFTTLKVGDVLEIGCDSSLSLQILESSPLLYGETVNGQVLYSSTTPGGTDEVMINNGTSLTYTVH